MRPQHHNICARCGSTKAFYSSPDGMVCPTCGFSAITDSANSVPVIPADAYDSLVEHRYGMSATAALRRKPQTKLERLFRRTWEKPEYAQAVLPVLLANRFNFPNGEMTERDLAVVGQFVQWLGSPFGQHYLYECGYTPAEEKKQ